MAGGSEFVLKIQATLQGNATSELSAAQSAASDALKKYQELERASAQTATALERLGAKSADVAAKMKAAQEAGDANTFWKLAGQANDLAAKQASLEQKASDVSSALKEQADAVEQLSTEYGDLRDAEDASKAASEAAANSTEAFEKSAGGIKKLGGPLGGLGDKAEEFSEAWGALKGKLGTTGAAFAVAAALAVALAAAIAAAAYKIAAFALTTANAQRNVRLTLEAMLEGADAAQTMSDAFSEVEGATGITEDRLLDITRSLKEAGVAASDMPAALRAIATQEKALGDTSGTQALIDDLKSGKKSAAELASEMEKKYGGVVEKKMLGLDEQMATFKKHLEDLFGGGNIEGFLKGLSKIVALFDQNTEAGRALKAIVDVAFGGFADAETIFTKIERFFLGMISSALTLAIWIKKVAKELGFDPKGLSEIVDVADLGKIALFTLLIPLAPLIVAIGVIGGLIYGLVTAFQIVQAAGSAAWQWITEAFTTVTEAIESFDLAEVGEAMIDGLVEAIKNGASAVAGAVKDVAKGAIDGAKNVLGIASPSKVFEEIGGFTVQGFTGGVDAENDNAQQAMEAAVSPPDLSGAKAGTAGAKIEITVNITASGSAEDIEAAVRRGIQGAMEDAAEQMGAAA